MADDEKETEEKDEASENSVTFKAPTNVPKRSKASKAKVSETEKRMEEAYTFMKRMSEKPEDDECSLYCNLLCKKLKALPENIREIAMLEIDKYVLHLKQNQNRNQYPQSQTPIDATPQYPPYFEQAPNITSQSSSNFQPSLPVQNRNTYSQQSLCFQAYRYPQLSPKPNPYSEVSPRVSPFLQPMEFPQSPSFPSIRATIKNVNNSSQPGESPSFQPHYYPQASPSPQLSHSPQLSPSESSQSITPNSIHSLQSSTQNLKSQDIAALHSFKGLFDNENENY